jgi:hypothetical protein
MNKRLLEHLLTKGFLDELQLRGAVARHKQTGVDILEILLRHRMLGEADLARALAGFYRYPLVDLNEETPQEKALDLVEGEFARKSWILPLTLSADRTKLRVAVSDPAGALEALEFIHRRSGAEPQPHVTERTALSQAINYYYFGEIPNRKQEVTESSSGLLPIPAREFTEESLKAAHDDFDLGPSVSPAPPAERSPVGTQPPFGGPTSGPKARGLEAPVIQSPSPGPRPPPQAGGQEDVRRFGRRRESFDAAPSDADSGGLAAVQEKLEGLTARMKRLEDSVEHDRRLLQTLMEVLIESGLTSRQELLERVRKG